MKVRTHNIFGRDDKKTLWTKTAKLKGGKESSQVRFICYSPFNEPHYEAINDTKPPHIPLRRIKTPKTRKNVGKQEETAEAQPEEEHNFLGNTVICFHCKSEMRKSTLSSVQSSKYPYQHLLLREVARFGTCTESCVYWMDKLLIFKNYSFYIGYREKVSFSTLHNFKPFDTVFAWVSFH